MKRFWVSWWSSYHKDNNCTKPPFQVWVSAERGWNEKWNDSAEVSLCAVIDAESERQVWTAIKYHFPDYEKRFCEEKASDYVPGDRFSGFEGRTTL